MDEQMQVEREAFMQVIERGSLRMIQIMNLMMLSGVVVFGAVLVILHFQQNAPPHAEAGSGMFFMGLLTAVHVVLAAVCFGAGSWLFNRLMSPRGLVWQQKHSLSQGSHEQVCA
ncbi:MAG: hypothetical protein GXY41_05610 [Phycisphaerae bacterium]|nr:hypothetical protein [Phycisphaerae bacterium]